MVTKKNIINPIARFHNLMLFCLISYSSSVLGAAVSSTSCAPLSAQEQALLTVNPFDAIAMGDSFAHVKILIDIAGGINVKDRHDRSLLEHSCKAGRLDITRYLLDKGAKITRTPDDFTLLSCTKSADVAKLLLEHGQDPNAFSPHYPESTLLVSELIRAVRELHEPAKIRLLLEYGAELHDVVIHDDGNERIIFGDHTALYYLIRYSSLYLIAFTDTTKKPARSWDKDKEVTRAKNNVEALLPMLKLLLCNGATVTQQTINSLYSIKTLILLSIENIQSGIVATSDHENDPIEQVFVYVKDVLAEMQKILIKAYNADESSSVCQAITYCNIVSPSSCRPLIKREERDAKTGKIKDSIVSAGFVIDPRKTSPFTLFTQVMRRQAEQTFKGRKAQRKIVVRTLLPRIDTNLPMRWPTRAEIVAEEERRLALSLPAHASEESKEAKVA